MGVRGPSPTPTQVLKSRGSWRAKARQSEPELPVEAPDCPFWLDAEAKAEWVRQVKQLETMGVVAHADRAMLAAYCEAWSEFVSLVAQVKKLGRPRAIATGILGAKNKASDRMAKLAAQFGFSPSARTRLKTEKKEKSQSGKGRFFQAR